MRTSDPKVQAAMYRVSGEAAFLAFLQYELEQTEKVLVEGVDTHAIFRAQGKARFLRDLLSALEQVKGLR